MSDRVAAVTDLRSFVRARMDELGISARDIARRSGDRVSHETVNQILRGTHSGRIKDRTMQGLATALAVDESRIYDAAGLARPTPWAWPERFNRLRPEHRKIVEQVAAGFLSAYDSAEEPDCREEWKP